MPNEDDLQAVRRRRTPTARSASASRRTAAASRRTRAATRTGPVATSPTSRLLRSFGWTREVGRPARRALHLDRSGTCSALVGLGARRPALRRARGSAATLAFAWAAYPFTQYVSNSNTNDAIMPALLIWGFWLVASPRGRAAPSLALAGWTKFAALLLAPLWLSYPDGAAAASEVRFSARLRARRPLLAFWILLLEPDPLPRRARLLGPHVRLAARPRVAVLDLGLGAVPRAGFPTCTSSSGCSRCCSSSARSPSTSCRGARRRSSSPRSPAALLIGFELVLTHWFYLYIPWFFPFVAFALLAPARLRGPSRWSRPSRSTSTASSAGPRRLTSNRRRGRRGRARDRLFLGLVGAPPRRLLAPTTRSSTRPSTSATATRSRDGEVPYRDFTSSTRRRALPAFVAARRSRPTEDDYRHRFEVLMMVVCGRGHGGSRPSRLRAARATTRAGSTARALLPRARAARRSARSS